MDEPRKHREREDRLRELIEIGYLDEQDLEPELAQDSECDDEE